MKLIIQVKVDRKTVDRFVDQMIIQGFRPVNQQGHISFLNMEGKVCLNHSAFLDDNDGDCFIGIRPTETTAS